jgi:hypothetical protein
VSRGSFVWRQIGWQNFSGEVSAFQTGALRIDTAAPACEERDVPK